VLLKVVKRVVVEQFTAYGNVHPLFPSCQFAYRHFNSTKTVILPVLNGLARLFDNGQVSALICLDLAKLLIQSIKKPLIFVLNSRFSIDYSSFNWSRSYLSGRFQSFAYSANVTSAYPITCSVP
jgi:hypothetical protein